jgi:hypothetical protein
MLKNSVKALLHSLTNTYKSVTLEGIISQSVEKWTSPSQRKLERVNCSTTFVFGGFEL